MNTKGLQMKSKILAAFGAAPILFTAPLWAAESFGQSSGESIETLAVFNGSTGANPGNIIQGQHGDFYGTTYTGGTYDKGTIFEIPLNKQVATLVNFNGANGASPDSHIVQAPDGTFYGTTREGGANNKGTVFAFTTSTFHTLVSFNGANGDTPAAGLLRGNDGRFYGTTTAGGATNHGTIFAITPAGSLTTIASFNGANGSGPGPLLRGQDGYLYGQTSEGGTSNLGVVYRLGGPGGDARGVSDPKDMVSYGTMSVPGDPGVQSHYGVAAANYSGDPNANNIVVLHDFGGADGANGFARLSQLDDGTFYGTTVNGGKSNLGTVFSMTPKGQFSSLLSFNGSNGAHPSSALVPWSNGYFYMERLWDNLWIKASTSQFSGVSLSGTTSGGGTSGNGTAFQITRDGTLHTLLTFDGTQGRVLGTIPNSLTPGDDGDLYGTTYYGGPGNNGTFFRILLTHSAPGTAAGFGHTPPPQSPNSM
jgi:uncharacterized repeat protein (TIGR03803 family)